MSMTIARISTKIVEKPHYIPVLSCLFWNFAMHEFGPEAKRDNKQNVTE